MAVGDGLGAGDVDVVGVGDGAGAEVPVETENEFPARPAPPTHGSKPAWMLVMYHERCA